MWNVKKKIISNNRISGTTSKSPRKYLSHIPGKHKIKELQTTATLAVHTYLGKYWCERMKDLTQETELHVPCTVTAE
jgi:hypothetical protein